MFIIWIIRYFYAATLFILLILLCDAQQDHYCTSVPIFIYNIVQRTYSYPSTYCFKKSKTENQIKRGHKSQQYRCWKVKVLFCVDLSMYHIHFKVMKSIKNSFMIENNKKREYGLIKQRNTEFCRTDLETSGGSYPFSNV